MKRANSLSLNNAVLIFSIFLIFLLLCSVSAKATADTSQKCEVSVSKAEIKSEYGVNGKSCVDFDKNYISPRLGMFEFPGAYSEIYIEIKNTSDTSVELAKVYASQPTLDYIDLILPSFDSTKTLAPNESCGFSVIVKWNPNSAYSTNGTENGNFGFKLLYADNGNQATSDSADSTDNSSIKTGDALLRLSAFCGIILILIFIYTFSSRYIRSKNKRE